MVDFNDKESKDQNVISNTNTIDISSIDNDDSILSEHENADFNNNISNIDTIDSTSKLVGLLTHTDISKIPSSTLKGSFICYKAAEDFTIKLPRLQVLNDFVDIKIINDDTSFQ